MIKPGRTHARNNVSQILWCVKNTCLLPSYIILLLDFLRNQMSTKDEQIARKLSEKELTRAKFI